MAVRILIADDHEIVREGVRSLIGSIWRGHEREGGRGPGRDSEAGRRCPRPNDAGHERIGSNAANHRLGSPRPDFHDA